MPSLADALKEAQTQSDPYLAWFGTLEDDDRAALVQAYGNAALSTKRLTIIIREFGGRIGDAKLIQIRREHGFPG